MLELTESVSGWEKGDGVLDRCVSLRAHVRIQRGGGTGDPDPPLEDHKLYGFL